MTRHAQPVRPGPILPSLINQRLTYVEYDRVNHSSSL